MKAVFTEQFGEEASSNAAVAEFLRERFYAAGNTVPWSDRIRHGTGRPLEAGSFLQRLSGA